MRSGTAASPLPATRASSRAYEALQHAAARGQAKRVDAIKELGLERFALELELHGLTVVPPEVTGMTGAKCDELVRLLLDRAEELVGCPFRLDAGPAAELDFGGRGGAYSGGSASDPARPPPPTLIALQMLGRVHRAFRDLAVHPVAVALIRHMIGHAETRFSSHNCFLKWRGEYGYGGDLGMHTDQQGMPLPWGRTSLHANTNWCLTDYSKEGGAFAYVPGSHHRASWPAFPAAVEQAVPVEAPRGSLIVFHGQLWHGAYPRVIDGMRVTIANWYRHDQCQSQEDIANSFPRELADDCCDPRLFKQLAGFGRGPYTTHPRLPRARPRL